jgi:glycogen operon protein
VRRTQQGNNNAYCQDNEISWFDWSLLKKYGDVHRFVQKLIRFRLDRRVFRGDHGLSLKRLLDQARIDWHGVKLHNPDWADCSHSLAITVRGERAVYHLLINAFWEPLEFELPATQRESTGPWRRLIDTYQEAPMDFDEWDEAPLFHGIKYLVQRRSVVLFVAEYIKA